MAVQPITLRRFLFRLSAALISVAAGWGLGLAMYPVFMWHPAGGIWHDLAPWGMYTGAFCLTGWFLVGLPLACLQLEFSSARRVILSVLVVGAIGVLMITLPTLSLLWRSSQFWPVYALAFVTASVSMLVYIALVRARQ